MPETYEVQIRRGAERELRRFDPPIRRRVIAAIQALAEDPHPPSCERLVGRAAWRIRSGAWRVVYTIEERALVVTVIRVAHRREGS